MEMETLSPDRAGDLDLTTNIAHLVNEVYAVAEEGLWVENAARTSADEIAAFIAAGEITVARDGDQLLGSIRVQHLDADTGECGMLALRSDMRNLGVGRELGNFAERSCVESGHRIMQVELLVPRTWSHPSKEFLAQWYERLGYRITRRGTIDELYPHLAPLLATPCDLLIYHKNLT